MRIVALAVCFNRCQSTLDAIYSLCQQELSNDITIDICIVDDGSTDDTYKRIHEQYPDVKLLSGTGFLYWAGGMRYGWEEYVKSQDFDYLLVFNDDIKLFKNAVKTMLHAASILSSNDCDSFAVTGALKEPLLDCVSYGGLVRSSSWHPLRFKKIPPADYIQYCDTLNMNFALINRKVLMKIGFLSDKYTHGKADFDFGLRLRNAGGKIVLTTKYVGECSTNSVDGTSLQAGISKIERWKRLLSIKEQPPLQRAAYYRTHGGLMWPVLWILPYIKIWFTKRNHFEP